MKRNVIIVCLALLSAMTAAAKNYDVAAYLYPAYAADDPRLRPFWPMGMGEWETVMTMQQRNPGHYWNRHPLWGYINEADSAVMEMEIEQATSHGINVFIFDWYWFDERPFMETTLTNGFLKAANRDKMRFYLMWANHNVENYWDTRIAHLGEQNIIWRGGVNREAFEKMCRRNIELFFSQPNYYKIDGKPVFMIYEVSTFIDGLGGVEQATDALQWFRREVKRAGFPDLELQFTMWAPQFNYSGFDAAKTDRPRDTFIRKLGFNSFSHYQFCHFINVDDDYATILKKAYEEWENLEKEFTIPYYPHVSIGWDNSPRTKKSAVTRENTPERFEQALRRAKAYLDARPNLHPLITINSWNEWTETSYLQPDNVYGYGYLDAVKHVFVEEMNDIVAAGEAPVRLSGSYSFTEGPAADAKGDVFFTDQPNNKIYRWDCESGKISLFTDKSGRSNGLYFDAQGNLIACADMDNQLWSFDMNGRSKILIIDFRGMLLNGPNDVWISKDGSYYLTDPYFKRDYWTRSPERQQPVEGLYGLAPGDKQLTLLDSTLNQPNGLVGTPDGKHLYVAEAKANRILRYDILPDGNLTNRQVFADMGSDGMTIDDRGNVYLTGDGVTVFNKNGHQIAHFPVPEEWTANVCFGGKERNVLFITASKSVYTLKMLVHGAK